MISKSLARLAAVAVTTFAVVTPGVLAAPAAADNPPSTSKVPAASTPTAPPGLAKRDPAESGDPKAAEPKHEGKGFVSVSVDAPRYTGTCPPADGVTVTGEITIVHPAVVRYRWVHDGKVVDQGAVKIVGNAAAKGGGAETVSYTFTPTESRTGWVSLEILSPHPGESARGTYEVVCEPPVEATASVTAPDAYTGNCPPISLICTGTVSVNRIGAGGTTVQYRWAGPDVQGPTETLTFAEDDPLSKAVSHTVGVGADGEVARWIEILSPNSSSSDVATVQVDCQPLAIRILDLQTRFDPSACGTPGYGPAITFTSRINVNGPVRVEYRWAFNNGVVTVPGSFETTGPSTVTVSHALPSSPLTAEPAMRASLTVTSHSGVTGWVLDFSPPPCPPT